jgi:uncharacterized oxidoreductase
MQTTSNTILITGGGTGIGEALAHRFHDLGNTVILAGRWMETLKTAAASRPRMHALTLDMDDPANVAAHAQGNLVEGVDVMRTAEVEHRFDDTLSAINPFLK